MKDILDELESSLDTIEYPVPYLRDAIAEIKQLRRRRDDLLVANNREVERRRAAENSLSAARIALGAVLKEIKAEMARPAGLSQFRWPDFAEHLVCCMSAARTEHSSWTEAEKEFEKHVSRNPTVAERPWRA